MQEQLNQFIQDHLEAIESHYPWSINANLLPDGINLAGGSNYEQNIDLKHALSQMFNNSADVTKETLIAYYIKKWGGIRRILPETIRFFTHTDPNYIVNKSGKNRIASWSKALCIRDPHTYAIFDARVSATLNLLQGQHLEVNAIRWFPTLPTRNNTIREINKQIDNLNGIYVPNNQVYRAYLKLINNAAQHLSTDIQTVEMILFTYPKKLYDEYLCDASGGNRDLG